MPRTSKVDAAIAIDEPIIEGRYVELDGYTVGFETHKADFDPAPLFEGLPGNRCQCPHWGVVVTGRVIFRYPNHDEVYQAGDAYYGRPGHLPLIFAGTELIEFSPTDALNATMAVVGKNFEAVKTASTSSGEWTMATPDNADVIADLSEKMAAFLETGTAPGGLFHPDALLDVSMPTWRIRALGLEDLIRVRKNSHPWPGEVTTTRLDPIPGGFVLEFEERWEHGGQRWYCREMLRADVTDGRISALTVYCTGDWDEARQQEFARHHRTPPGGVC